MNALEALPSLKFKHTYVYVLYCHVCKCVWRLEVDIVHFIF